MKRWIEKNTARTICGIKYDTIHLSSRVSRSVYTDLIKSEHRYGILLNNILAYGIVHITALLVFLG